MNRDALTIKVHELLTKHLELVNEKTGSGKPTWKFKDEHSDETIAKELGCSPDLIVEIRNNLFGQLTRGGPNSYRQLKERQDQFEAQNVERDDKILTLAKTVLELKDALKAHDRRIVELENEVTKPKPVQANLPFYPNGARPIGR